ncbi:hypothetical protein VRK_30960 [Vibrio sp. MEBiC08052]|nr:hypothetical protein VRK_30960 [Vibrio sp. MEBiC08052]
MSVFYFNSRRECLFAQKLPFSLHKETSQPRIWLYSTTCYCMQFILLSSAFIGSFSLPGAFY